MQVNGRALISTGRLKTGRRRDALRRHDGDMTMRVGVGKVERKTRRGELGWRWPTPADRGRLVSGRRRQCRAGAAHGRRRRPVVHAGLGRPRCALGREGAILPGRPAVAWHRRTRFGYGMAGPAVGPAWIHRPGGEPSRQYRPGGHRAEGFLCLWERARDLSALLDVMGSDREFAGRLDIDRVFVGGFSAGAYTAMALLGAITVSSRFQPTGLRPAAVPGPQNFRARRSRPGIACEQCGLPRLLVSHVGVRWG